MTPRRRLAGTALAALLLGGLVAAPGAPAATRYTCNGQIVTIFDNTNKQAVVNGGTPPHFKTRAPYCLTSIETYHWNGGHGAYPGTLGLHRSGGPVGFTSVGPVRAQGFAGQDNAPDVNWIARFPTDMPTVIDGYYRCQDSSPSTWSTSTAGGPGFCIVSGIRAQPIAPTGPPASCPPEGSIYTKCADVFAGVGTVGAEAEFTPDFVTGDSATVSATVGNYGPDETCAELRVTSAALTLGDAHLQGSSAPPWGRCQQTGTSSRQSFGVTVHIPRGAGSPGGEKQTVTWTAAPTDAFDPVGSNNKASVTLLVFGAAGEAPAVKTVTPEDVVGDLDDVVIPASVRTASAAAARIADVRVAILDTGRCRWAASTAPTFTAARRPGACGRPTWLRAQGTAHWRLHLARRLPRGRYLILTQAVDARGNRSSLVAGTHRTQRRLTVR